MNEMRYHPLADIFPLIEGVEFDELVTSIRENGQQHAIVVIDDMILDGRNRYRACLAANVAPRFETFVGCDPIKFVIDINVRRRHLNESQRGLIAAKISAMSFSGARTDLVEISTRSQTTGEAAEMLNVNRTTVSSARKVLAEATPEEIKAVQDGHASVNTIAKQLRAEVSEINRKKARAAKLSQTGKNPERIQNAQINAKVWEQLRDAIENISNLPLPSDVAQIIAAHTKRTLLVDAKLFRSLQWLEEFYNVWSNRDKAAAQGRAA